MGGIYSNVSRCASMTLTISLKRAIANFFEVLQQPVPFQDRNALRLYLLDINNRVSLEQLFGQRNFRLAGWIFG